MRKSGAHRWRFIVEMVFADKAAYTAAHGTNAGAWRSCAIAAAIVSAKAMSEAACAAHVAATLAVACPGRHAYRRRRCVAADGVEVVAAAVAAAADAVADIGVPLSLRWPSTLSPSPPPPRSPLPPLPPLPSPLPPPSLAAAIVSALTGVAVEVAEIGGRRMNNYSKHVPESIQKPTLQRVICLLCRRLRRSPKSRPRTAHRI